jgi:hypothetical protein
MRFMNQNFIDADVVSNSFVSSEQTAFPVSNIYNKQRRSKVWRSNGYWEVVSGDNTIVFRETIGVDLTATVAAGAYTSSTSFFAAVKAALEAAGDSTYTVSADATTGKVKILSSGTGGGGIFQLMWTNVASADMAALMGFDSGADQTGALTYLAAELRISTGEWIKWDMGISSNPTALIITGPRNSPLKIVPSATIKLQGNETDTWDAPSFEQTLTYDDANIVLMDPEGLHTEGLRYWRLEITDLSNPLGYVEIGKLFLGEYFESTRGKVQFGYSVQQIDRSTTVFSEGGQSFSDIREKSEQISFRYFGLTKSEKESLIDIFEEFGTSVPLFVCVDPDSVFTSSVNRAIKFVKFESEPQTELVSPNNFSMSITLREEL